jgi:hypothetical protein
MSRRFCETWELQMPLAIEIWERFPLRSSAPSVTNL